MEKFIEKNVFLNVWKDNINKFLIFLLVFSLLIFTLVNWNYYNKQNKIASCINDLIPKKSIKTCISGICMSARNYCVNRYK